VVLVAESSRVSKSVSLKLAKLQANEHSVSNQLSWIAIGIASLRFRAGLAKQGKTHLLPFRNYTYPYGPWLSVILNIVLVLVQGWSCFSPAFDGVSFVSFYIELPIMLIMFLGWKFWKRTKFVRLENMDLETDVYEVQPGELDKFAKPGWKGKVQTAVRWIF
jgi:AAT family amino acid transporter